MWRRGRQTAVLPGSDSAKEKNIACKRQGRRFMADSNRHRSGTAEASGAGAERPGRKKQERKVEVGRAGGLHQALRGLVIPCW